MDLTFAAAATLADCEEAPLSGGAAHCELRAPMFVHDESGSIVMISKSRLFRDCLGRAVVDTLDRSVVEAEDMASLKVKQAGCAIALIVVCVDEAAGTGAGPAIDTQLRDLPAGIPVAVIGDREDPGFVVDVLRRGINGYISTELNLDVTMRVMALLLAGGTDAPTAALLALWRAPALRQSAVGDLSDMTSKQLAVIEAIRRGKANKIIAYELNMCEGTVKVHVRNIMKKLRAQNWTQVAYIANQVLLGGQEYDGGGLR